MFRDALFIAKTVNRKTVLKNCNRSPHGERFCNHGKAPLGRSAPGADSPFCFPCPHGHLMRTETDEHIRLPWSRAAAREQRGRAGEDQAGWRGARHAMRRRRARDRRRCSDVRGASALAPWTSSEAWDRGWGWGVFCMFQYCFVCDGK